jgi:hypothetical protein
VEGWQRTRDDIHAAVLRHGWSQRAGAFTQYYGSDDLDASNLMMPIVGFLSATEPRVLATINAGRASRGMATATWSELSAAALDRRNEYLAACGCRLA